MTSGTQKYRYLPYPYCTGQSFRKQEALILTVPYMCCTHWSDQDTYIISKTDQYCLFEVIAQSRVDIPNELAVPDQASYNASHSAVLRNQGNTLLIQKLLEIKSIHFSVCVRYITLIKSNRTPRSQDSVSEAQPTEHWWHANIDISCSVVLLRFQTPPVEELIACITQSHNHKIHFNFNK